MDMYLTAIGYAMLRTRPDTSKPTSPAEEDAYYARVGALSLMDPWVGHAIAWTRAMLATAHSHTPAAARQPVRHA